MAERPPKRSWRLPVLLAVAAIAFVVVVTVLLRREASVPIVSVAQLDDDTLLVLGASGSDTDTRRWSAIATVGADGVLRDRVYEKGVLQLIAVDGSRVWLDHDTRKVHTRTLPGLQLELDLTASITNHPALSHGYQIVGLGDAGLELAAVGGKRFVVTRSGSFISPEGDGVPPRGDRVGLAPTPADVMTRKLVAQLDLDQPSIVGDERGPLRLDDPPGYLVRSFELVVGGGMQSLHRVGTDGEIVWSTTAAQLADAVALPNQAIMLQWVGRLGGELTALVQLSEYHAPTDGDRYAEHSQWLVTLDPHRGAVTGRHAIAVASQ